MTVSARIRGHRLYSCREGTSCQSSTAEKKRTISDVSTRTCTGPDCQKSHRRCRNWKEKMETGQVQALHRPRESKSNLTHFISWISITVLFFTHPSSLPLCVFPSSIVSRFLVTLLQERFSLPTLSTDFLPTAGCRRIYRERQPAAESKNITMEERRKRIRKEKLAITHPLISQVLKQF